MDKCNVLYAHSELLLHNKKEWSTDKWVNLEHMMLSERNMTWKTTYYTISFQANPYRQKVD